MRAYVHEPPLGDAVVFKVYISAVDRVEYILRPRHEQPYYGGFLLTDRLQYPLRADTAQKYGAAARDQAAEPVHFGARMIKGRYAQKYVVAALTVMRALGLRGAKQSAVGMEDSLGKARCARGEVYCRVVVLAKLHRRRSRAAA